MRVRLSLLFFAVLVAPLSHAVVITTGDGSGNVTAPSDDPGWANVGDKGETGVYIGGGWVITAKHAGAEEIILGGVTYSVVDGSAVQLWTTPTDRADLLLFQIHDPPDLPALGLSSIPPTVGSDAVVMIGRGRNRLADKTYWDEGWNEVVPPGLFSGWKGGNGRTLRWATNVVTETGMDVAFNGLLSREFAVDFDDLPDEGQAAAGDSGGAVFIKRKGVWVLAGIMNLIDQFVDQPSTASVLGNRTLAIDISFYREQILTLTGLTNPPIPTLTPWKLPLLALILVGVACGGLGLGTARQHRAHFDR